MYKSAGVRWNVLYGIYSTYYSHLYRVYWAEQSGSSNLYVLLLLLAPRSVSLLYTSILYQYLALCMLFIKCMLYEENNIYEFLKMPN